jgi:hypothetical protein
MPLQRNVTDHPLDVPAASVTVQPGDTVDWALPIVGFEPVDQADSEPEPSPPKSARKRAASEAAGEETPR